MARRARDLAALLAGLAGAAAVLLGLLLELVRARARLAGVTAAGWLVTPGERPTRVLLLGLTGLMVGAAQLAPAAPARAALLAGYPAALLVLAALEAVGCGQLLAAARRADTSLD